MQGQAPLDIDEAARLNDVDHEIGLHLGGPVTQSAESGRSQIRADPQDQNGHHYRGGQERAEYAPWRHARRVHNHDFRVRIQPVERVADCDHKRQWRNRQNQHRNQEAGDANERQDGLTLIRH